MSVRHPSPALVIALLALAVAIGGVAIAAPGGGGAIQGCYNARGALRVVDTGTACEAGEAALSWNQQGVAGPPGAAGARGDTGSPGVPGPPGAPSTADAAATVQLGANPNPDGAALSPALDGALNAPVSRPKIKIKPKKPTIKTGAGVYQAVKVGTVLLPPSKVFPPPAPDSVIKTVARLDVPAGKYLVVADARIRTPTPGKLPFYYYTQGVRCQLHATGQGLLAEANPLGPGGEIATLQGAASSKKPGGIELRCVNLTGFSAANDLNPPAVGRITISAIAVDLLSVTKK